MSELLDLGGHGLGRRYDALDAGWRGAMLRALGLGGGDLQWVPGALDATLTETEAGLSILADRMPPRTATAPALATGRSMPRWSMAYRRLLGALLPEIGVGLRGCLGSAYPCWVRYRNAASPDVTQQVLFRRWARESLPDDMRGRACRLFDAAMRDPVSRARDAFGAVKFHDTGIGPDRRLMHVPGYALSPASAVAGLFPTRGGRVSFDSDHLLPAETGGLAPGGAQRPALLPGLRGDAFDPLERRLAAARIGVLGHVGARAVVPVVPRGWYDAQIVNRALAAGPCSTAWDSSAGQGGWPAFFGRHGSMLRHAAQLLMVSDMRLGLTYAGQFDETEQARILAGLGLRAGVTGHLRARGRAGGGIWPFVVREGQSALRATAHFDAMGSLKLDLVLPPRRLMFWGVRVGHLAETG
ncbi:hypothetical protein ACVDG3_10370 [Meridianimarinicoccus sp. RP-17]|uniref:hypothetical protein n=1 Tax=Meridianimarinicoccus zhengii TaxID=2056810 RepID=UPI0013A707E4|nr:hypothetical protein [Phycocomes zhengii]